MEFPQTFEALLEGSCGGRRHSRSTSLSYALRLAKLVTENAERVDGSRFRTEDDRAEGPRQTTLALRRGHFCRREVAFGADHDERARGALAADLLSFAKNVRERARFRVERG